jgi:hypothetical protein
MKKRIIICLFFLICLLVPQKMPAWGGKTHKLITQSAILNSLLAKPEFLKKFNFERTIYFEMFRKENETKSLRNWAKYGSVVEDNSLILDVVLARSPNHFHNPLKNWVEAGLDDWTIIHSTGYSAILWAQLGHLQVDLPEGDNTWDTIRTYFYAGLTAVDSAERQKYFAETFKGLGHQVHLLEDMAVPDHVRNDAHVLNAITIPPLDKWPDLLTYRCIEGWAENNLAAIQTFVDPSTTTILFPNINLNRSGPVPLLPFSYLYDTDSYNSGDVPSMNFNLLGLSEYTNANFVSEDTIFSSEDPDIPARHQFPYPKKASTDLQKYIDEGKIPESITAEDGKTDLVKYIAKTTDGASYNHFLAVGYFGDMLVTNPKLKRALFIDNLCHKDYASMLIPRAVGYSAKLLDYFFRGDIEISLPEQGVYAISENEEQGFNKITLLAKNVTPDGEEMSAGIIKLVVRYRKINGDPFQSNPPIQESFEYFIAANPNDGTIVSIPRDNPVKLEFDLPKPIPMNASDVILQLIYKGTLGFEKNSAVVVGYKDISEPTPMDVFNNMDKICLFNNWYVAGSQAAIDAVDKSTVPPVGNNNGKADEWDVNAHDLFDVYLNFNQTQASSAFHLTYRDMLPRADDYRVFLLADNGTFNMSVGARVDSGWVAILEPEIFSFSTVENRLKWYGYNPQIGDNYGDIYGREIYSAFGTYRTIDYFALLKIVNSPYPADSSCADDLLNNFKGLKSLKETESYPSGAKMPSQSVIKLNIKLNKNGKE